MPLMPPPASVVPQPSPPSPLIPIPPTSIPSFTLPSELSLCGTVAAGDCLDNLRIREDEELMVISLLLLIIVACRLM